MKKRAATLTLRQQLAAAKRELRYLNAVRTGEIMRRLNLEKQLEDLGAAIHAILPKDSP